MQDAIVQALHPYLVMLLEVLAAIIMGAIGWGLKRLWQAGLAWFHAHTSAANQAWIEGLAKEAYAHAERFYKNVNGDEKLNAAVNYLMRKINLNTIGLTREDIAGAVQRAWQDYNQQKQPAVLMSEITPDTLKSHFTAGSGKPPGVPNTTISS